MKDKFIEITRPLVFLTSFTLIIILGSPLFLLAGICSGLAEIFKEIKYIYRSHKALFYLEEE